MEASRAAILRARLEEMEIDHVVLWVDDPKRALEFYVDVIGLEALRAQDFEDGTAPFPSVRVNDTTIVDLMGRGLLPFVRKSTAGDESGGEPVNHVCLSMGASAYDSLVSRLVEHGIRLTPGPRASFGAQGVTPHSAYFRDPDGNVLEIRHYGGDT
jgi:catechol 2,3-dioxygenase-like lactoylglutathione lyase family enzyme